VAVIRAEAVPVQEGTPADQVSFDLVGVAHVVLIGEASHGTSEYSTRPGAQMTAQADRGEGILRGCG